MKKESPHITSGMTIMPPIVGTTHTARMLGAIRKKMKKNENRINHNSFSIGPKLL